MARAGLARVQVNWRGCDRCSEASRYSRSGRVFAITALGLALAVDHGQGTDCPDGWSCALRSGAGMRNRGCGCEDEIASAEITRLGELRLEKKAPACVSWGFAYVPKLV